jgi:hypothetical protein
LCHTDTVLAACRLKERPEHIENKGKHGGARRAFQATELMK